MTTLQWCLPSRPGCCASRGFRDWWCCESLLEAVCDVTRRTRPGCTCRTGNVGMWGGYTTGPYRNIAIETGDHYFVSSHYQVPSVAVLCRKRISVHNSRTLLTCKIMIGTSALRHNRCTNGVSNV